MQETITSYMVAGLKGALWQVAGMLSLSQWAVLVVVTIFGLSVAFKLPDLLFGLLTLPFRGWKGGSKYALVGMVLCLGVGGAFALWCVPSRQPEVKTVYVNQEPFIKLPDLPKEIKLPDLPKEIKLPDIQLPTFTEDPEVAKLRIQAEMRKTEMEESRRKEEDERRRVEEKRQRELAKKQAIRAKNEWARQQMNQWMDTQWRAMAEQEAIRQQQMNFQQRAAQEMIWRQNEMNQQWRRR